MAIAVTGHVTGHAWSVADATITDRQPGLYLQQDGVTPHFHQDDREYLDSKIPRR